MDLSFTFDRHACVTAIEPDLAVLMVGIAARQAASPTARAQSRLAQTAIARALLAPMDGAFNTAASNLITDRREP